MSMSLEQFAKMHGLPERWLSLRRRCETLSRHPQFWSRLDLMEAARKLATEASDILCELRRHRTDYGLCDKPKNTRIT